MSNVSDPTVHVRRDRRAEGVIAYLTIDDGRGLNVMSSVAEDTLTEALLALADNQDLRAVVLTGAGPRAFSVGADIKELAAIETSEQAKVLIARLHRSCEAIRNLRRWRLRMRSAHRTLPRFRARRPNKSRGCARCRS